VAKDGNIETCATRTKQLVRAGRESTMRTLMVYVRVAGTRRGPSPCAAGGGPDRWKRWPHETLRTVESQIANQQRIERMNAGCAVFFGLLARSRGDRTVRRSLVPGEANGSGKSASGSLRARRQGRWRAWLVGSVAAWAALGLLLALPGIYYGSNAVRDILFEVPPMDPVALLWAAGILAGVASLAAWLPARRAASVAPSVALRTD
jgi:hypothetical protein